MRDTAIIATMKCFGTCVLLVMAVSAAAADPTPPRLIDTIGPNDTEVRVLVHPDSQKTTWTPAYTLIVEFEGHTTEDVIVVQWKQGKKAIGKPVACAVSASIAGVQTSRRAPVLPGSYSIFECGQPKTDGIKKGGKYQLGLTYKQTLVGTLTDLGTLEFTVMELKQGARNKPDPSFAINHDHRLNEARIEEAINSSSDLAANLAAALHAHYDTHFTTTNNSPSYVIKFWTKHKAPYPPNMNLSCLFDGKKVTEGRLGGGRKFGWSTYKGAEEERGEWTQQVFNLYQSRVKKDVSDARPDVWVFGEHPGEYRCVATVGGEMVKEMLFTIGPDGKLVDTACQAEVRTLRHIHVIKAKDGKVTNTTVDKTLGKRGFFGRVTWPAGCPAG